FALSKARGDWVLFVDADEVVTDELREDILARAGKEKYNGYYMNRKNHFLSQPVNHCGWAPDFVMRCFRKDKVAIPETDIHEGFKVDGETAQLKGNLLHYSYNSISEYFRKMNRYTSLEVEDKLKRIGNKKIHWYDILLHSLSRFSRMYFTKKGYKDGITGFFVCFFSSVYLFVLYSKMWEKQQTIKFKRGKENGK
ncbi:glycosyltransferase family 2 protein, partial [bacterium]|nr:glycosyltransferase family 2 protein [bacterium]